MLAALPTRDTIRRTMHPREGGGLTLPKKLLEPESAPARSLGREDYS